MRHLIRWTVFSVFALAAAVQSFAQCTITTEPGNGGTVERNEQDTVVLKWSPVAGATSYDIFFGSTGSGCTSVRATETGTQWSPPPNEIDPGATYEWRVVANGTNCGTAPSSACSTFTVTPCPAAPPTLTAPAQNAEVPFGTITISWSSVANADDYQVYIGIDGDTPSLHFTGNSTSKNITVEPGRTIEWYVVARGAGCDDQVSATNTFTTTCPTGAPSAISPPDHETVPAGTNITFKWSPFAGAAGYDLKVNDGGGWEIIGENLVTTQFTTTLPEGDYQWEVRANFNGDCNPAYSAPRELVVGPSCTNDGPAELLTPAANATSGVPVTFSWTPRANARSYSLYVQKQGAVTPRVLTQTGNDEYTTDELVDGKYQWWVLTDYENCADAESARRTLTISGSTGCPSDPQKTTLISPAAGANLTSPVIFAWHMVPEAKGYRVVATYGNGQPVIVGTTTSTSLSATMQAGSGFWAVQTLFGDDCPTTISEPRAFTVTSGSSCSDAPPTTIAPANGATVDSQVVTFRWNGVPNANRYRLFVATGNDAFSFYGETNDTSFQRFVPAGNVRWFVVATFAACANVQSSVSTFVVTSTTPNCPNATINLSAPADDAVATSPTRFAWSAVQGATGYRLWVAIDEGAPFAVARTTALEASVSLPAGRIRWFVEAVRDNCDSVISERRTVTIQRAANCGTNLPPVLVSPLGTRTNPARVSDDVTLAWTGVERAIGYRVWIGRNGDAYSDVALTRETSFAVEIPKDGLYGWYVQALFEACDPVASEPAFFFSEDGDRCPTAAPSAIEPAQGSTPTASVTFRWTGVAEAEKYRLFLSRDGETRHVGTTEETELSLPVPPGSYVWSVEAVYEACPSTFSARVPFTVAQSQNCNPTGAQLVSPANGATNVAPSVDFVWNPVPGALKYVLIAKVNDGAPTPFAATTNTHHVVDKVPHGTIEWWVLTYFPGCEPAESAHARFTVARLPNCDNRRPIVLIPSGNVTSPVHFQWTGVPKAASYKLWIAQPDQPASVAASTEETETRLTLPEGTYEYFVEAIFPACASTESARGEFTVVAPLACGTPAPPEAQVIGQALSNTNYRVRWTPVANVGLYEVQESTSPSFANAKTFTTSATSLPFSHEVTGTPVQYLYRVRGVSDCNEQRSAFSDPVGVFVTAAKTNNASAEIGLEGNVVQTLFLPGGSEPLTFTASVDKPWLTVTPANGTLPVTGLTLTVTADPSVLNLGTNTGTVRVQYSSANGKGPSSEATTLTTIPVSVSLVTPVAPSTSGTPPPDSLIFPVVGHAQGANDSLFESDIRITNLTAKTLKYALKFTPSGTDGTQSGSESTIEVASGSTLALDDVVASLFGIGTTSSATGMLEVRPLATTSSASNGLLTQIAQGALRQLDTAGSSRTYNFTPTGTFGQFIPATRYADFIGKAAPGELTKILSLQQVAQSAAYRANFGFAEAAGQPADLIVRVYDTMNTLLKSIPISLRPREHTQINGMLAANGITDLPDGRVEVEVIGGGGKVTAYVSEVDNKTNDPLLVSPVVKGSITANRYVVPGTAYIQSDSFFWVTDLRVFNAGAATPATLTFYPQGNPTGAVTRDITLAAGEIKVLDNVIGSLFAQPNGAGGMIAITTPSSSNLTATARTYNKTSNGTYGQYIPGVTPAESAALGDRPLQLLQLEQSSRFRTNIGLAETSGQPVTVEVSAIGPDTITTPYVTFDLQPNEFRQFSLGAFGLGDVYNARVAIKVIGGNGRVTAYGSAIDQQTQDPTYVPAQ